MKASGSAIAAPMMSLRMAVVPVSEEHSSNALHDASAYLNGI